MSMPLNFLCAQGPSAPGGKGDGRVMLCLLLVFSSSQCSSKSAPRKRGISFCKIMASKILSGPLQGFGYSYIILEKILDLKACF